TSTIGGPQRTQNTVQRPPTIGGPQRTQNAIIAVQRYDDLVEGGNPFSGLQGEKKTMFEHYLLFKVLVIRDKLQDLA
ncbi:1487_t:CDS:2, partial [Gigaspora margarita]